MSHGHKSPYEIRQQLLQLAFEILREQHHARAGTAAKGETVYITSAPTTEDVISEARKLNEFISARGDRS